MSITAIREYIALLWEKYQEAKKVGKIEILDELCRNLNIHRKSATRLMTAKSSPALKRGQGSGGRQKYSQAAKNELKTLWREMGYLGAVRLKAALPDWLPFYEGPTVNDTIKSELLLMSVATIERTLKDSKADLNRRLNTGTRREKTKHETVVPIKNFTEIPKEPGHCEVDCVAHCGGSISGTFIWTVTLTDMDSGWTECEAIWGKSGFAVRHALMEIEKRLPFKIKGLYFDNGCEFLNDEVIDTFALAGREIPLKVFRGRPYKKNDQPYVEQKNYTHVRQFFGYERLDWKLAQQLMNSVYRGLWRQLQNHFYPQIKLVEKIRCGAKIKRKVGQPKTPYARLMENPFMTEEQKNVLRAEHKPLNPFALRKYLRKKLRDFRLYAGKDKVELGRYAV